MTDAGYYRGTTADQDTRFGDKTKKLMKTLKFSDQLNEPVDMRKVPVLILCCPDFKGRALTSRNGMKP